MTRILFIRHGLTDPMSRILCGRMPNVHLNQTGSAQTSRLGEMIQGRYELREIVSSPLERARETAARLAAGLPVATTIDDGFTELDYGDWTGKTFEDIRLLDSWQHYHRSRSTGVPPAGESLMQVQARAWSATARILERYDGCDAATVAVVSHGDVIRALLVLALGIPMDHIHRFDVSPASWSEVTFEHHCPRVVCINQTVW